MRKCESVREWVREWGCERVCERVWVRVSEGECGWVWVSVGGVGVNQMSVVCGCVYEKYECIFVCMWESVCKIESDCVSVWHLSVECEKLRKWDSLRNKLGHFSVLLHKIYLRPLLIFKVFGDWKIISWHIQYWDLKSNLNFKKYSCIQIGFPITSSL